jgi:hypothetical protein
VAKLLEAWCFKDAEKFIFLFFCFWLGLLLCMLLWNGFGELVLVMECDPSCSRDTLYEQCEARFCERIGAEISGERMKVERRKIYEAS